MLSTNLSWDTCAAQSLKSALEQIAQRTGLSGSFMTFDDPVVEFHTEN